MILSTTEKNIQKARKILKNGGVIIYPTDTLYGLGADINNQEAIKKVFVLKGRNFQQPISVMVSEIKDIQKIALVNKNQERFIQALLPGPFTVILKKKKNINKILTGGKNTIGIRMPDSKICRKLSYKMPITTTSANISGQKPTLNVKKMANIFGNKKVELILKGPPKFCNTKFKRMTGKASAIIDLTFNPPKILR